MRNTSSRQKTAHVQADLFQTAGAGMRPAWNVVLEGRVVPYSLRMSRRARRVWLKVDAAGGLEVVVPHRMPLVGLEDIIRDKAGWILDKIRDAEAERQSGGLIRFEHGAVLPYLGKPYRLEVIESAGGAAHAKLEPGLIRASVPRPATRYSVRDAVVGWYMAQAKRYISGRVALLSGGRKVAGISIRDQKTRWGSCSPSGRLSFNWRLMMSPPEVVDYLVIHELAHLERPDHSKTFWKIVKARCPEYREREAWLKVAGRRLFSL